MRIGTFNVRGVIDKVNQNILLEDLKNYNLDILTLQETHIRGTKKIELDKDYTFYNTGPVDHSFHGVGIVVKNSLKAKFEVISERICKLTVESPKFNTTVFSAYAPTLTKSKKYPEVAEQFYINLQSAVDKSPKRNHIFVGIDANAQLGKDNYFFDNVCSFGHGHLNSNGEKLGHFLIENNLIATNTYFDHKIKHRITWTHPNPNITLDKNTGQYRRNPIRNQIDYILTNKYLRNHIIDSRSYHGTKTDSDHCLVICKTNIKPYRIFRNKEINKPPKINLTNLEDKALNLKYKEDLSEKIKEIQNIKREHNYSKENSINWETLTNTIKHVAENTLGLKEKYKNKNSNNKIKTLSNQRHNLRVEKQKCNNPEKIKEIQEKRNKLGKEIKKELKTQENKTQLDRIKDIEAHKNDSRRMFQAVRELNKKEDNTILIENDKKEIIHNTEEEIKEITHYFENIFKQEETTPIPSISPQKLDNPITTTEVKKAISKIKNNKSPGSDNIPIELVKEGPIEIVEIIAEILNNVAETGNKPLELSLGQLVPLPKPNKPKGPVKNLRPIILLSVLRKILAIIVVDRTFQQIRDSISITQAAYSPGRSTTELAFTFKILIEQAICSKNQTLCVLLLDMSRAFDTIDRGILLKDLKNLIKPDILHLINVLLTDVKIQVKHKNKLGNIFTPDIGSPQGDCASPIWFIFYLHLAIVEIKQKVGNPRDSIIDIKHDHTYSNISKKVKTPKGQHQLLIDQQYADAISWATENKEVKDSIKEAAPPATHSKKQKPHRQ